MMEIARLYRGRCEGLTPNRTICLRSQAFYNSRLFVAGKRDTRSNTDHTVCDKNDLWNFDTGEAVICRQGTGWVQGRIKLLEESSDDRDTAD